ncbi:MAG: general secretion pathway protein B [Psychromonas sp.]|jgi:general secretion pathway protein B|uniref:general secretion pathway protein GspB n=1 Tax=Psychromonas sp. TaxID=1884585 RepID=UPI0039E32F56
MSTILAALQKQKSSAGEHFVPPSEAKKGLLKWRVALLTSLLVIISLLCVLLYLQLNGAAQDMKIQPPIAQIKAPDVLDVDPNVLKVEPLEVAPPIINETAVKITKTAAKAVKEMTFVTQPLPEVEKPELSIKSVPGESTAAAKVKGELDYSAVSDDLQQRFELALFDSTGQDKVFSVEVNSDGRDLHEMSSQFQQKVPNIIYDAHLFSSIAKERWIKINGKKLKEGQFDPQSKIELLEIQPNRSIFRLGRQSFSLESLTDWKGY